MHQRFLTKASICAALTFQIFSAHAIFPLWSFRPLTPTHLFIADNDVGNIQYMVTNESRSPHTLVMLPIDGVLNFPTKPGDCPGLFALGNLPQNRSCNLNLKIVGSSVALVTENGPFVCQMSPLQCYQPENPYEQLHIIKTNQLPPPTAALLTISRNDLALSVNDTSTNPALTGTPRILTVTNAGGQIATGLATNFPTWPTGTTASSNCGSSLNPGASCTITVTPGSEPTSDCDTGIAPTPGNVSVTSTNANTVSSNVVVLTYACLYQGGLVYAVNDTLPNNVSISGKVATDLLSSGVFWSSDGNPSGVDYSVILGIDETSTILTPSPTSPPYPVGTPPYIPSEGNADGLTNSNNIVSYYNFNRTGGGSAPTPLNLYAAGNCKSLNNGFADWYLPAICEMGYPGTGPNSGCGTPSSPKLQNMQSNLVDYHSVNLLSGNTWSSTEGAADPLNEAWEQTFGPGPVFQNTVNKTFPLGVVCSRIITP
ncbi:MAG: hypothetical protein H0U57_14425 [Tatlockia sp.]|nr:hypothetical protein [Tatlockia sp.]